MSFNSHFANEIFTYHPYIESDFLDCEMQEIKMPT